MSSLRLEKVTPANVDAACELKVRPDQEEFVAPVAKSLAEAYLHPQLAWPRVIVDGEQLVGFVMGFFDVQFSWDPMGTFRSGLWRLNISADQQCKGYGRFAVQSVCDEIQSRGQASATVTFVPGVDGPERFYRGLGFHLTGDMSEDQVVAERVLTRA